MDEIELERVRETAERLISESPYNMTEGADVARALGMPEDDPNARLYHALNELERRGDIDCMGWHGGMGLPYGIRRAY
jgi:hypothetical protein